MTFKVLRYQLLVATIALAGSVVAPLQGRADPGHDEANAIRQTILQGIRDDIQRRTNRQRDIGQVQVDTEREKPKPLPQKAARHATEKQ